MGVTDMKGTTWEDDFAATSFGNYVCMPLLRNAFRPGLSQAEARKVLEECMRVMFYRHTKSSTKVLVLHGWW